MDPALEIEISALSRQRAMNEALEHGDSDIQKFYANTTVFLTGGTGFLGKHLIEKLFRINNSDSLKFIDNQKGKPCLVHDGHRSCKITKMYLLIRSKKGKPIKERLEEMLEDPLFSTLQKRQPEFSSRLVCVEGDASQIRLGLSERDWQMLANEVEVIFHCAATTRFDEKLRTATRINVRGTREALLLARAAGRLKSFVHVSTAFFHATTKSIGQEIREVFYPTPISPETLIHLVEEIDEGRLDAITPELIKNWPNTYTFCKAAAEEAVRTMSEGLPVSVIRPAAVIASYCEPSPGWLDKSTVYGASGIILGLAVGVLHVMLVDHKVKVDLVPCDYVTNAVIVAGRETSCKQQKGGNDTPIYNVSSVARNNVTFKDISYVMNNDGRRIASPYAVYYNYGIETRSKILFRILSMFLQIIPAYFLDAVCFMLRRDRMFVKLSKKAEKMLISLSYFLLHEWIFLDNNTEKLYKNLSKKDKLIFNFDITNVDWKEFLIIWAIGVRKYLIKDGLKSTDVGIRNQFWLRLLHYCLSCVYFYVLCKVIIIAFTVGRSLISLIFT